MRERAVGARANEVVILKKPRSVLVEEAVELGWVSSAKCGDYIPDAGLLDRPGQTL